MPVVKIVMQIKDKKIIREIMRNIIWDYNLDPYDLFEVVTGKSGKAGHFNSELILLRMIERLSWYDLINLLGIDYLKKNITSDIIARIRDNNLKEKYEFVRKVLQGEAVSFSGWSPGYRKKIEHTLLSDRWYRAQ